MEKLLGLHLPDRLSAPVFAKNNPHALAFYQRDHFHFYGASKNAPDSPDVL